MPMNYSSVTNKIVAFLDLSRMILQHLLLFLVPFGTDVYYFKSVHNTSTSTLKGCHVIT